MKLQHCNSLPEIDCLALLWHFTVPRGSSTIDLGFYPHWGVTLTYPGYWESASFGLN